jgi:two-component system LytT family response regulator
VQRGIIVNTGFVKEYRKYIRGKYILVLDDLNNTKLETGRSFTDAIKELMVID